MADEQPLVLEGAAEGAAQRARAIIKEIRKGWKDGLPQYSDGQVWQAMLDAESQDPDYVAIVLIEHANAARVPPTAQHIVEAFKKYPPTKEQG